MGRFSIFMRSSNTLQKWGFFFPYSAQKQGGVLIDAFLKTSPNRSKRKGKDGQESIQKMRHPLVLSSLVDAATTKQEETYSLTRSVHYQITKENYICC